MQSVRTASTLAGVLLDALVADRFEGPYFRLPNAFLDAVRRVSTQSSEEDLSEVLRLLLLHLIDRAPEIERAPHRLALPESIRTPLEIEQARIRNEYGSSGRVLALANDLYVKDLAVATFKLLPAGAQLVDVNYGVPRATILRAFRGSVGAGFSAARYLVGRCGGFRPAVEIHTSSKTLGEFTEDGWRRCYLRIADLMQLNPSIRSMYGMSWFYDPKLAEVSPRLSYLRDEPASFGARIFYWGSDEKTVANALATSETRRRKHEAGEYRPEGYLLVWSRRDMLQYRSAHEHSR
jgi:hypothetical protein